MGEASSALGPEKHPDWNLSIRTTLLPKETNYHGTIFGGVILSYIDMAGAVETLRFCRQMVVTVAMNKVVFKQPVFVGDLISFFTQITDVGRSSMAVSVRVVARRADGMHVDVTEASVVYVAVDAHRRSQPVVFERCPHEPPAFSPEMKIRAHEAGWC